MSSKGPPPDVRLLREIILTGTTVLVLIAAVWFLAAPAEAPPERLFETAGVLMLDTEGFRYTFHCFSGTEGLFDLAQDPRCLRNLAPEQPQLAARFRLLLDRGLDRKHDAEDMAGRAPGGRHNARMGY